jgi:hypothetical protein
MTGIRSKNPDAPAVKRKRLLIGAEPERLEPQPGEPETGGTGKGNFGRGESKRGT